MKFKNYYQTLVVTEGGADIRRHESMAEVIRDARLTDPEIVSLARMEIGEVIDASYINGEIYFLKERVT